MQKAENGMYVCVDYTGTLQDGKVFDTSQGRQPLEFKVGAGQLIKGFENAVEGMALNEKKTFTLAPEEAYGQRDENQTHAFPRSQVPPGMDLQAGQKKAERDYRGAPGSQKPVLRCRTLQSGLDT